MEEYVNFKIENSFKSPIFNGIESKELKKLEESLCIRKKNFEKNQIIFSAGDLVDEIGIVLRGSVNIENVDLWGNKSILSNVAKGQVFAEPYALSREPMLVDAVAAEPSEIMFLNINRVMKASTDLGSTEQSGAANCSTRIISNLLNIAVHKNITLSNRIFCTTPKTVRARLLMYLSGQSLKNKSTDFTIPFNRQQMADYLNLDRSALSKELCKMRDEGLIEFRKNHFILKNHPL